MRHLHHPVPKLVPVHSANSRASGGVVDGTGRLQLPPRHASLDVSVDECLPRRQPPLTPASTPRGCGWQARALTPLGGECGIDSRWHVASLTPASTACVRLRLRHLSLAAIPRAGYGFAASDRSTSREFDMAEPKTRPTTASVDDFIDSLDSESLRDDCRALAAMMQRATGAKPEMWGASIIGFGRFWWTSASGKKVEWMLTAFAPRKANLTLYLWPGFDGRDALLDKLGKHARGKGCVYIKRLSDVHLPTLEKLIATTVRNAKRSAVPVN
jgi:hypothetical protein